MSRTVEATIVKWNRGVGTLPLAAAAVLASLLLTACPEKGPAEKAGEKIDEAAEEVGDALK